MKVEAVIGLEVHVQLATRTKLFCGDAVEFGAPPNSRVCPVCLGLPGALPVMNADAVRLAVRAALGLSSTVHPTSLFVRKSYFYPDLPKGYQITQYDRPLATGGRINVSGADEPEGDAAVRIRRIHLEEDAGKSLHDRFPGRTAVDLNRAGVPLIEIVTEPDLRTPEQARDCLLRLKRLLEYLDVADCDMEKGGLRVDANISVRPIGDDPGAKTELKNLNSFSAVERGLRFEIDRQSSLLRRGGAVARETLLWDEDRAVARPMRSKEEDRDYRYFADPDLAPLVLDEDDVERIRDGLPELPEQRFARFVSGYGLPEYDAGVLTATRSGADYFEAVVSAGAVPKAASNWIMTEVMALSKRGQPSDAEIPSAELAALLGLIAAGTLSHATAKRVLRTMAETGRSAGEIAETEGLVQVSDEERIGRWARQAVDAHPAEASRYRGGEARLMGFFMGELMRRSGGRANPRTASAALRRELAPSRPAMKEDRS